MLWLAKLFGRRVEWNDGHIICIAYWLGDTMYFDRRAIRRMRLSHEAYERSRLAKMQHWYE